MTDFIRLKLLRRVQQLAKLVELNGPENVVANQVGLVVQVIYGDEKLSKGFAEFQRQQFFWMARRQWGMCLKCEDEAELELMDKYGVGPMCPRHLEEETQEIDRME